LRSTYFDSTSPSYIQGMSTDLVDNSEVHVRVKAGVEGTVVFDSAIALLQGLFPPNPMNKIKLANETVIVAPLGGYQYVPGMQS
jgi:lysosomal acid phosphatase